MKSGYETVGERGDRRRRSEYLNVGPRGSLERCSPSIEREGLQAGVCDKVGLPRCRVDNDGTRWKRVDGSCPEDSVLGANESTTAPVSLRCDPPVQFRRKHWAAGIRARRDGALEREIVSPPAEPTRAMASRQRHGIVQEEQRCPRSWCVQWML